MKSREGRAYLAQASAVLALAGMSVLCLMLSSCLSPVEESTTNNAVLMEYLKEQYIVGVSDSYHANGDLAQAAERLAELGDGDPAVLVSDIAAVYMERGEALEATRRLIDLAQALGADDPTLREYLVAAAPSPTPTDTAVPTPTPTESPTPLPTSMPLPTATYTRVPPPPPTATPTAPPPVAAREWDRRVDYFWPTVRLEEARVSAGQWYWRLIKMRWQEESGNHHIYVEVLDQNGDRSLGQTIVMEYGGSPHYETYPSPDKLGEEYAYNFVMQALLGAYNVYIGGAEPSDKIYGLGLGTRQEPYRTHHTCFFLTFQRTYQP